MVEIRDDTSKKRRLFVVITAAGSGLRLGYRIPKAFVRVCGKTLLEHACERFFSYRHPDVYIDTLVISLPAHIHEAQRHSLHRIKHIAASHTTDCLLVKGGATRQASIYQALQAFQRQKSISSEDLVVIHDAARSTMPHDVLDNVMRCLLQGKNKNRAVVPGLSCTDTMYETGGPSQRTVVRQLCRENIYRIQTPQGFYARSIIKAHAHFADRGVKEETAFSDDAQLMMASGGTCFIVDGSHENVKVTYPQDIRTIEQILARSLSSSLPSQ